MENAKMRFTDFPPCKHRFGCLQCRNDIKFVEHMKKRFGDWECPEKIPFGTPLELMPEHIKTKLETYQNNRISQGKDIPQIKEKNLIGSGREMPDTTITNNKLSRNTRMFSSYHVCRMQKQ